MNARLRIFQKKKSGNQDLKKVHQTDLNPGPHGHDHQANTLTTRLPTAAALTLLMYTVANPDPNPWGGGELPNPNECNSTLTTNEWNHGQLTD